MITAGVDVGAKNVKVLILKDGVPAGRGFRTIGLDTRKAIEESFNEAVSRSAMKTADISRTVATGAGRKEVKFADGELTEVGASAKGAHRLFGSARTVIDVGAEEGRAIKVGADGKVLDFAVNEKCAAGAGAFTEAMARALEVKVEDLGPLSLKSQKAVPMNAQCAVFAESEVVSLIHAKTPKEDIARAVHDAISDRIISMVRRVGVEKDIAVVGGLARNVGFIESIKRSLAAEVLVPEDPDYAAALGAALHAVETGG
ncbi:MAG: CoA activase [Elusimicrobia bacterium]|nr:CoA activase [Elusimicrobiota bacterium]